MYKFWAWLGFGLVVLFILLIDLLSHRANKGESHSAALTWITVWISVGPAFNLAVWAFFGFDGAQEYLAAYLIEESLSLDNVFIFLVIFQTLQIPQRYQHRVLFWGVLGAVILRAAFIFTGVATLNRWKWISFVLGAVLLYSGYRALREDLSKREENKVLCWRKTIAS